MKSEYKVADMFAGVGGASKAFEEAGAKVIWANEYDKNSCDSYRLNLGDKPLIECDIRNIKCRDVPNFDILVCGLPCQPFSRIEKGFDGNRQNNLFLEFLRFLDEKRPRAFLLECGRGLYTHNKKRSFEFILKELKKREYYVKDAILTTYEYGNIPQKTSRLYLVGFNNKREFNFFKFPQREKLTKKFNEFINIDVKKGDKYYYNNSKYEYILKEKHMSQDNIYSINRFNSTVKIDETKLFPPIIGLKGHRDALIVDNYGIRSITPEEFFKIRGFYGFKVPQGTSNSILYRQASKCSSVTVVKRIADNIINAFVHFDKMNIQENIFSIENNIFDNSLKIYNDISNVNLPINHFSKKCTKNKKSINKNRLVIAVQNEDGTIDPEYVSSYDDWIRGKRDTDILRVFYGNNLLDILTNELGYIQIDDNDKLILKYVLESDRHKTTMRLLGNIAEALVVKRCNEDIKNNIKWATIARKGKNEVKTLEKFMAIGTGLISTKNNYRHKYNPSDTQRDILWIDTKDVTKELLQVGSNSISGNSAGLQVKVSLSGESYILNDLKHRRYEVPLVYFGLNDDFDIIANKLYRERSDIVIGEDFINAKAINHDIFEELYNYYPLVLEIIEGKMDVEKLYKNDILNISVKKTAIQLRAIC